MSDAIARNGLPVSSEAERMILGGILVSPMGVFQTVAAVLSPGDFALERNRTIYVAMLEVEASGQEVDRLTVSQFLKDRGELEKIGGLSGLLALDEGMPQLSGAWVESYIGIVREKAALRRIVSCCSEAIDRATAGDTSDAVLSRLDRGIAGIAETGADQANWRNPGEVIADYPGGVQKFLTPSRGGEGVPLPWNWLQENICGLQPGDMVVIAGRPSHGKSVVGIQIGEAVARFGLSAADFSLEMGPEQIVRRMVSSAGNLEAHKLRHGYMNSDDRNKARAAVSQIEGLPFWIDYRAYSPMRMRLALKRLVSKLEKQGHPKLGVVIVDHFHLLQKSHPGQEDRSAWVQASHDMKRMAKEFGVPFVVLCQLSRKCEDDNREPQLSDLGETGALEQDADIVMFTHRPEMYVRNRNREDLVGFARFILAKQRNGPTGACNMVFLKDWQRFEEAA